MTPRVPGTFTRRRDDDDVVPMYVFACNCRRIVSRNGPKIAKCVPRFAGDRCYSPGELATDDDIRAAGLDPEEW